MGRVGGAGAVLVVLVVLAVLAVLGAPPAAGEELSEVFQWMLKLECHFIHGSDRVRLVERFIYNREQLVHFDSDLGHFVGDTPFGEIQAKHWNSQPELVEEGRVQVDTFCRHNYEVSTPDLVSRRVPPSVSISLVQSSSQSGPGRLLCSVMDFYPAPVQVRWFQDGQELPEHVMATDMVPNGDWTYQVLVMLEIPPRRGVTYTCQVEHVSLEHPLSRHWEKLPPAEGKGNEQKNRVLNFKCSVSQLRSHFAARKSHLLCQMKAPCWCCRQLGANGALMLWRDLKQAEILLNAHKVCLSSESQLDFTCCQVDQR